MTWLLEAVTVFIREWQTEWRTRVALSSTLLFAVGALTLIGIALRDGAAEIKPPIAAGLVWILILFTAATGLGRAFVQEEERGTALALRLTARATVVWAGKCAANLTLLWGLTLVSVPALLTLLGMTQANVLLLFFVLALGCVGVAAVFTTTSALVAEATAKGGLLAALSFPVLVPLLVVGVRGTTVALSADAVTGQRMAFSDGLGTLQVLLSYAVVMITASLLLIDFIWND